MHRRLWLFAGTAVAILSLAAAASATTKVAGVAHTLDATSAAAPFALSWANVPRTTAGRKAKSVLVFGEEQDINGFNTNLTCCNALAGGYLAANEALHGAYLQNDKGQWIKDVVVSGAATKTTLTYTISPKANWYWGGKKVPVTWSDFAYTWQQIVDPKNDLAGRTGYNQIGSVTHKGAKTVTFHWKTCPAGGSTADNPCGPFAYWQSLFSSLYPAAALAGQDFNKIWTNCICGNDGQPVADGPFYLANYTKGQGTTLKANPFWYGKKQGLAEVDFKIIADTNTEVQAMRGGEVDAIAPTFGQNLVPLKGVSGITFNQLPGYFQEHIDLQEGPKSSNPLLRTPWMRQAVMMGIDRQSIINTVYGQLAGNTKPLNSLLYFTTQADYTPDFKKWDYNQVKALALLKKHCTGGPSAPDANNSSFWTCSGFPARFRYSWTASNATRTNQEAIAKAQLKAIGIEIIDFPRAANVIFGPTGIPSGDYDLANFAWVTTGDPGDLYDTWRCGGDSNYLHYCSKKASSLLAAGGGELDPAKRTKDYQQANAIMAAGLPSIPLYQRPVPLIYKSDILGMKNNPGTGGPMWNIEDWKWKS